MIIRETNIPNQKLIFLGDSLLNLAQNTITVLNGQYVPVGVYNSVKTGRVLALQSYAISGYDLTEVLADIPTKVLPILEENDIVVIGAATNDLGTNGLSAAQTFTNLVACLQALQTVSGVNIIVNTVIARDAVGDPADLMNVRIPAYNALVRNGASTYGYRVNDLAADAMFDTRADASNLTNYNADKVHLATAGQDNMILLTAASVETVINAYLLSSRTANIVPLTNAGLYDWQARPDMAKRNGITIMVSKESTNHVLGDGYWNINFSNDDGVTWTPNNTKIGGGAVTGFPYIKTAPSADQCDDAELILCANGDLLFISHERLDTAPPGDWITHWQHRSTDGGNTWTAEFDLGAVLPGVADKTKLWAFYDYEVIGTDLYIIASEYTTALANPTTKTSMWKSSNNGLSYTKISEIFAIGDSNPSTTECGFIHTGNGRFVAISRTWTLTTTVQRISLDYGVTWGPVTDISILFAGQGVHQPRLQKFTGSDRIFLTGRDYKDASNWRNGLWYSDNNCASWVRVILDTAYSADAGYTKLIKKDNGDLFLVGYYGSTTAARIFGYIVTPNT